MGAGADSNDITYTKDKLIKIRENAAESIISVRLKGIVKWKEAWQEEKIK